MIKYCKEFECIEFPNEGGYWIPIEDFNFLNEYGMNEGYFNLCEKYWFKNYIVSFKKLMLELEIEIDYKKVEDYYISYFKYLETI